MIFPTKSRSSYRMRQMTEQKISHTEKIEKLIKGIYLKILTMTKYENGISRSQLQREFDLGAGQFERIMHRVIDENKNVFYDRRSIPRLYKTNPLYNKEIEETASKAVDLISLARKIKGRELITA